MSLQLLSSDENLIKAVTPPAAPMNSSSTAWKYSTVIAWTLSNITGLSEDKISIENPPQVAIVKKGSVEEVSLIYACHLTYNAMDYPEVAGNNSRLFNNAKRNLSEAIESGEVDRVLQWDGKKEGFVNYEAVQTGNYSFSYLVLDQGSASSSSSSSSGLSGGAIAGIVIGGVIFGLCCFYLLFFFLRRKSSSSTKVAVSSNN